MFKKFFMICVIITKHAKFLIKFPSSPQTPSLCTSLRLQNSMPLQSAGHPTFTTPFLIGGCIWESSSKHLRLSFFLWKIVDVLEETPLWMSGHDSKCGPLPNKPYS